MSSPEKLGNINVFLSQNAIDIVCLTETRFDNQTDVSAATINTDYICEHVNRKGRKGDGVTLFL